jgi:hypothetical protein
MFNEPEDLLERAAWYREKADRDRQIAAAAPLHVTREAYENMAKTHDTLADRAEELHRMKNEPPTG